MKLIHSTTIAATPHWRSLLDRLVQLDSVVVAFSGGVDSTLLAKAARDVLGDRAIAATAVSASLAAAERKDARDLARAIGIEHVEVTTREGDDPRYAANALDRCYFCKSHLFVELEALRSKRGLRHLAYGAITDDLGDHRPGMVAAREAEVSAPLLDAGLDKAEVREASHRLGLPTWDKPAIACLASRLPTGTTVTPERLSLVDRAEEAVRALGFRQVRVRHHGDLARIEVDPTEVGRALELHAEIASGVRAAGYSRVEVDPRGYGVPRVAP